MADDLNDLLQQLDRPVKAESAPPVKPQRAALVQPSSPMKPTTTTQPLPRLSNAGDLDDIDAIVANMNFDPNAEEASGICSKCKRAINKSQTYVEVRGKPQHLECHTCTSCRKQLAADDFFEPTAGARQCQSCFTAGLDKCAACHQHITPGTAISHAEGRKFHQKCFTCSVCSTSLTKYVESGGKFFCEPHYADRHNPKCISCNKAITSTYATTDKGNLHVECFKCHKCQSQIGTGKYFVDGSSFVCGNCNRK